MTQDLAKQLVKLYVEGWKEGTATKILQSLSANCEIIESHGPIYNGAEKVKKWVEVWIQKNCNVAKWNITSFYYFDNTAVFQWDFGCNVQNKHYSLEGISIVKFENDKIKYLREYRTIKTPYEWDEKYIEGV